MQYGKRWILINKWFVTKGYLFVLFVYTNYIKKDILSKFYKIVYILIILWEKI